MKGFSKDLVSVRTAQAIRSKNKVIPLNDSLAIRLRKIVIRSNCLGYSLEKEMSSLPERLTQSVREKVSSVRTARAIRSKKMSSVQTSGVIRSNGSSYPLKIIVSRAIVPNHFHPSRLLRTCQEIM